MSSNKSPIWSNPFISFIIIYKLINVSSITTIFFNYRIMF
nr:MAG TPA: hypothetical protein [Caudoviricetes sp.]